MQEDTPAKATNSLVLVFVYPSSSLVANTFSQISTSFPSGVFIFRWEQPARLGNLVAGIQPNKDGLVPVIYRADMKEPATYFASQHFKVHDGDVIYISDSHIASLQHFVNLLSSSILPIATVSTVVP